MVFPLYDDNPFKLPVKPYITWGLIALNIAIFLITVAASERTRMSIEMAYAVVPAAVTSTTVTHGIGVADLTFITGLFLHGGWEHLLGNMIYLWVFGDDIEEVLGPARFFLFYLLAGVGASIVYVALNPDSAVPLVGASGAISGILAAYLMLRPCAKVVVFIWRIVLRIRAYWVIGAWILLQFFLLAENANDGVAYAAHVGGFVIGALLFMVMRPPGLKLFECMAHETVAFEAEFSGSRKA